MTAKDSPDQKRVARRRWPLVLTVMFVTFLATAGLGILYHLIIPPLVEETILEYADRYGIKGLRLDLRQITPWQADFHALRVMGEAADDPDQLGIESLVLTYTPWGLSTRVIDAITLSGLVLKVGETPEGWKLAGLPSRYPSERSADARPAAADQPRPAWQINRLNIHNSRLEIHHGQRLFRVPFEFQAHRAEATQERYRGQLRCQLWNQSFQTILDLDWDRQQLIVEEATAELDVQHLARILEVDTNRALKGQLTVTGNARLSLDPLAMAAAEFQIHLADTLTFTAPWALRVPTPETPLVTVKMDQDRNWVLNASELVITTPEQMRVRDLTGRLEAAQQGWRLGGALNLEYQPAFGMEAVDPKGLALPVTYKGLWQADEGWTLSLNGQGPRWKLEWPPASKTAAGRFSFIPQLALSARIRKEHVTIETDAHLKDLQGLFDQTAVRVPVLSLHTTGTGDGRRFGGRYGLKADNLRLQTRRFKGRLPRFGVEGAYETAEGGILLSGKTSVSRGSVQVPDEQLKLDGIRLELPFAWPHAPGTAAGHFRLAAATWHDRILGAVQGRIRQQAHGAELRLTHQSALLPGAKLNIEGRLDLETEGRSPRVTLDYRLDRPISPTDIDLGTLTTDLAGVQINGRIAAQGRSIYENGRMQADLKIELAGGRLSMPDQKVGMVGLKGRIVFPDLLALRTAPRQSFSFERSYMGDIAATDGQIDFQIEPGGIFFLEQGRFQWCRGTVYLPATRVVPDKNSYDLILWCDRLKLAPLLEQLGAARAEGGGSVSGRIPIRIRAGQFRVDNGFLYSSPGEGGTIRLRGTDLLTAGIPPGSPQYNQLELARQALEEYDYDWVKLSLATAPQEDLLRLKLQLNGRPANPLPFIYDTQAGGFVPAGPDSKGSRFEEIKLDVNFSLPLNRLLEYKDLLKLFS